jgi:N-acetyl-anhydromuramyl-L-alanine amidase AmpD
MQFANILSQVGSPALAEAGAMYGALVARQVHPAVFLGFFQQESRFGMVGICNDYATKNPGNVRTPEQAGAGAVIQTPRGQFVRYPTWVSGTADWALRMRGPKYEGAGLTTVREVLPKYAPKSDQNDPQVYADHVIAAVQAWTKIGGGGVALQKPAVVSRPSPNHGYNGAAFQPRAIVWHIAEGNAEPSIAWLCNPASNASSNYLIGPDGTVYELVNPANGPNGAAWGNGAVKNPDMSNALIASWVQGGINPNLRCISIEHAGFTSHNLGGSLTPAQVTATVALTAWLCQEYNIEPDQDHILGHYQIDDVDRHYCPGFSAEEWRVWVDRVATSIGASSTPGPGFPGALQVVETVLNGVNFQGSATCVEKVTVQVRNALNARYRRTWSGPGLGPWVQVYPPAPPATAAPGFPGALNAAGETVLNNVNFGGIGVCVEEVSVQVRNAIGDRFQRSWSGPGLGVWAPV